MTRAERDALRSLLAKATPGPWEAGLDYWGACCDKDDVGIEAFVSGPSPTDMLFLEGTDLAPDSESGGANWKKARDGKALADATLIAAAVNALPALLDQVEALEVKAACGCGRPSEFVDHWCGSECAHRGTSHIARVNGKNESLERERDALKAENERLRKVLMRSEIVFLDSYQTLGWPLLQEAAKSVQAALAPPEATKGEGK